MMVPHVRYGIFGGSFDPIHRGHATAAEAVLRVRHLDRIFLIPAARPPHKPGGTVAPFEARVALARLAVKDREGIEVLDIEGNRSGPSYTVDTLVALKALHPDAAFELLVGADMLEDLPHWRRARELVAGLAAVVAFARPGVSSGRAREGFAAAFGSARLVWVEVELLEASSSLIRRELAAGKAVDVLLDPRVFTFIREKGLYGAPKRG